MAKKIDALIVMNKANKQINLTLPKKQLSKKDVVNLSKAKRVKIDLTKFYSK